MKHIALLVSACLGAAPIGRLFGWPGVAVQAFFTGVVITYMIGVIVDAKHD